MSKSFPVHQYARESRSVVKATLFARHSTCYLEALSWTLPLPRPRALLKALLAS